MLLDPGQACTHLHRGGLSPPTWPASGPGKPAVVLAPSTRGWGCCPAALASITVPSGPRGDPEPSTSCWQLGAAPWWQKPCPFPSGHFWSPASKRASEMGAGLYPFPWSLRSRRQSASRVVLPPGFRWKVPDSAPPCCVCLEAKPAMPQPVTLSSRWYQGGRLVPLTVLQSDPPTLTSSLRKVFKGRTGRLPGVPQAQAGSGLWRKSARAALE